MNEKIKGIVSAIIDADLGKNLAELESLKSVQVNADKIDISIDLIQPYHLAKQQIANAIKIALKKNAIDTDLNINFEEKGFNPGDRKILHGVKNIIAVASGKGGVGKSSIAANLAIALSKTGAKVGLLDADVYGPSVPLMFGMKDEKIMAEDLPDGTQMAYPAEKYGIKVASMGFLMKSDEAAIVRGPMLAGYFSLLFEKINWGVLDYLIFDLPPGTGDIQLTLTQKVPLTGSIIVTTPQEIAVADVRRAISMFRRVDVNIVGILENMSYFTPPELPDNKYYIFGQGGGVAIAKEFDVDFLGEVPLDLDMRDSTDRGEPILISNPDSAQAKRIQSIANGIVSKIRKINFDNDSSLEISV